MAIQTKKQMLLFQLRAYHGYTKEDLQNRVNQVKTMRDLKTDLNLPEGSRMSDDDIRAECTKHGIELDAAINGNDLAKAAIQKIDNLVDHYTSINTNMTMEMKSKLEKNSEFMMWANSIMNLRHKLMQMIAQGIGGR